MSPTNWEEETFRMWCSGRVTLATLTAAVLGLEQEQCEEESGKRNNERSCSLRAGDEGWTMFHEQRCCRLHSRDHPPWPSTQSEATMNMNSAPERYSMKQPSMRRGEKFCLEPVTYITYRHSQRVDQTQDVSGKSTARRQPTG